MYVFLSELCFAFHNTAQKPLCVMKCCYCCKPMNMCLCPEQQMALPWPSFSSSLEQLYCFSISLWCHFYSFNCHEWIKAILFVITQHTWCIKVFHRWHLRNEGNMSDIMVFNSSIVVAELCATCMTAWCYLMALGPSKYNRKLENNTPHLFPNPPSLDAIFWSLFVWIF